MLNILTFLRAALPWVLTGIPIAIFAASTGKGKGNDSALSQRVATGAALGLLLGVTLNGIGIWDNHALGFAIGPLWGMALAAVWKETNQNSGAE